MRFPGYVGQDDIRPLFTEADVFCLPSVVEGVPVVLMEAMAMELPVVTTRMAGIPELVEDGESGLLTVPGPEGELVAALETLARDPELRARMGRAGRAKVITEFQADSGPAVLNEAFGGVPSPSVNGQGEPARAIALAAEDGR